MSESLSEAVLAGLRGYIPAEHREAPLVPDMALGSLGINSLQLVELVYELEVRFALHVEEEQLVRLQTVGDLQSMFATAGREDAGQESGP